jgi:hypothetical protein
LAGTLGSRLPEVKESFNSTSSGLAQKTLYKDKMMTNVHSSQKPIEEMPKTTNY